MFLDAQRGFLGRRQGSLMSKTQLPQTRRVADPPTSWFYRSTTFYDHTLARKLNPTGIYLEALSLSKPSIRKHSLQDLISLSGIYPFLEIPRRRWLATQPPVSPRLMAMSKSTVAIMHNPVLQKATTGTGLTRWTRIMGRLMLSTTR